MLTQQHGILNYSGVVSPSYPIDGLTNYWRFNETSGTAASDSIGSNIGTLTTSSFVSGGKRDYGVRMSGNTSMIDVGTIVIERTDSFSISMWLKGNGGSSNYYAELFGNCLSDWITRRGIGCFLQGDYNALFLDLANHDGKYAIRVTTNYLPFQDTNWHNLIVTYNGTSLKSGVHIYIDGVEALYGAFSTDTLSGTIIPSPNTFKLGYRNNEAISFNGIIDECAIWNRVLTQTEVTALYNSGNGLFY